MKKSENPLAVIKKMAGKKGLLIGEKETLKRIKAGKAKVVFLASNCPEGISKDIEHYCRISGVEVHRLDVPNDELGVVCKKPFPISVISRVE